MKTCAKCGVDKLESDYYMNQGIPSTHCKDCYKSRVKAWREANPEKTRKYYATFRDKHRDTVRGKAREIHESMVQRSKKKNFDYPEWTIDEIQECIEGKKCKFTGIDFSFERVSGWQGPWVPVPDRIDSSLGYTKDNVQWVCNMFNAMKMKWSMEEVSIFITALKKNGDF